MGELKFRECEMCHELLPANREYFTRHINKETGKEYQSCICKKCEYDLLIAENWKDGKLKCFICGEWLDPSEFDSHTNYKHRNHKDARCKKCKRKLNREARANYDDNKRLYKILNERFLAARKRAKDGDIPFNITLEFIEELWEKLQGLCAISKIPMTYTLDKGRCYSNVSIDQINHKQGYTEDNVQLVCSAVNQLKSDWDMNTVIYICLLIIDNKELINSVKHKEGGILNGE